MLKKYLTQTAIVAAFAALFVGFATVTMGCGEKVPPGPTQEELNNSLPKQGVNPEDLESGVPAPEPEPKDDA